MRKISLMLAFFAASFAVKAQDNVRSNAIKLNPLSLAFLTGNVAYERAVSENTSVQLGVFYSGLNISDVKYSGLGITPEFRIYFAGAKQALNGVYAAPFARYQNFKLEDKTDGDKTTFTSIGGGAIIGWQKMWGSGFTLDIFAGPSYNSAKFKNDSDEDDFDLKAGFTGFGIRTGLTLGFGF
jgi:hypothetical protein